ncbi:MAG: CDP-alcohol phosphatidyltransferase [Chloroflexota bacterium]|nr:CDP-alcohol phosphatidyltransferase [Chloroflexota bacterium]
MTFRHAADTLTAVRAICGLVLPLRSSLAILLFAIVTDWLDGPLARRAGPTIRGARFDLEADSILTLGASVAAARVGASSLLVIGPALRYAVAALAHRPLDRDGVRWDRITGVAQMAVFAAALAPEPLRALRHLAVPVSAGRCAVLLVQAQRRR